ncbi:hypothetical protein [Amycolatopsis japonica]|uniref:hypothetical protein n=1 Tax=Amycolatopsis japonica TaxID=208439 RepID=UPI00381061F5
MFTDESARVLAGSDRDILPAAVRAPALRLLWAALVIAALGLVVVAIVIGRLL